MRFLEACLATLSAADTRSEKGRLAVLRLRNKRTSAYHVRRLGGAGGWRGVVPRPGGVLSCRWERLISVFRSLLLHWQGEPEGQD